MDIKVTKRKGVHRIAIAGEATIYEVSTTTEVIGESLRKADEVRLDLSGIGEMDSAFCQVVLAAMRQGEHDGKKVELTKQSPVSEKMMRVFLKMHGE